MSVNRWIDTENAVYIHSGILFSHGRIVFHLSCLKESGKYAERNKWGRKRQTVLFCYLTHLKSPIMKPRLREHNGGSWGLGSGQQCREMAVGSVQCGDCSLWWARAWEDLIPHILSTEEACEALRSGWLNDLTACVCMSMYHFVCHKQVLLCLFENPIITM